MALQSQIRSRKWLYVPANCGTRADVRGYLARTLTERFRESFFSNAVLVVEGPTDQAIFQTASELAEKPDPSAHGISIVNVTKGSQPIALGILGALGIPAYCVFDGDAGATDGNKCETCGRAKTPRTSAIASNKRVLEAVNGRIEEFPATTVEPTWACFHENIEASIEGFAKKVAEVSQSMGWSGKSAAAYSEALRTLGRDAIPREVDEILNRVIELTSS